MLSLLIASGSHLYSFTSTLRVHDTLVDVQCSLYHVACHYLHPIVFWATRSALLILFDLLCSLEFALGVCFRAGLEKLNVVPYTCSPASHLVGLPLCRA